MSIVRKYSIADSAWIADELEQLLASSGVPIAPGSALERMVLSCKEINDWFAAGVRGGMDDEAFAKFTDMAGLVELGTQLMLSSAHPSFAAMLPHLRLLNEAEVNQGMKAKVTDSSANKVFELLVACYAAQWGGRIELDDPVRSSNGTNPDVVAYLAEGSVGIACKVLHSRHPQTIIDNIEVGLRQIDRSNCDTGFVFISLKNVLDRKSYWPSKQIGDDGAEFQPIFLDFQSAEDTLKDELLDLNASLGLHAGSVQALEHIWAGHKAAPMVVFYAHAVCSVLDENKRPSVASLKFPYVVVAGSVEKSMVRRIKELHEIMQLGPTR